jgi:hypothetical protein
MALIRENDVVELVEIADERGVTLDYVVVAADRLALVRNA